MSGGNTTATIRGVIVGILISCLYSVFCGSNLTVGIGRKLYSEDGDEHEIDERLEATSIVYIVIILICITIAFEAGKEKIEKSISKDTKPIIESLFGEMTILGFLSVCTFFVKKSSLFEMLSTNFFGKEEHELLVEIFEQVHFALFFVMIIFVIQVLVLVNQGMNTEKEWLKMERKCRNPAYIAKITMNPEGRDDTEHLLYHALREEFINERFMDPPFLPISTECRIPADFNFGRYLSISLGNTAAHIVHLHEESWAFFIFFSIVVYVIFIVLDERMEVFAWIWAGFGWLTLLSDIVLIRYLTKLRHSFAVTLPRTLDECKRMEEQPLLDSSYKLPGWCRIDMDAHLAGRSWITKKLSPHKPNRQNACFWLERIGPEFHLYLFQIGLVFVGLYCAFLAVVIFPVIWSKFSLSLFMTYTVLAILPILLKMKDMRWIITIMSQVGCMGTLRNASIEATVIREAKTFRIIGCFLALEKIHRCAENGFQARTGQKVLDDIELEQIGNTFDTFDTDANGSLSLDELEHVMCCAGFSLSQDQMQQILTALDLDGNGMVEKDEFLLWYKSHMGDDDTTLKERAHNLFKLFTKEGNDDRITIGEFKTRLTSFSVGFTVDDIREIVRVIDEDGDVMISLKEFEKLLENHYPTYLQE